MTRRGGTGGEVRFFCNCHVRHATNNNLLFVFFLRCCKELCNEKQFSTKLICRVGRSPVFDGTIRVFWYNDRLTISLKIRQVSKFGILSGIYFNVTLVQRHSIKQHLIKFYLPKAVFRIKKSFSFSVGAAPRTPLKERQRSTRPPSPLGREIPNPIPLFPHSPSTHSASECLVRFVLIF